MTNLKGLFGFGRKPEGESKAGDVPEHAPVVAAEHEEQREHDLSLLDDEDGAKELRLHQQATKEVQSAAETSIKKLHVLRLGRCPECGEHLRRHLFATICEACGWHSFEVPKTGGVIVHLAGGGQIVGDCCHAVRNGDLLLLKDGMVIAKIARSGYSRIEYLWSENDINQRRRQIIDRLNLTCGWCNDTANPDDGGFHLVHVALGATQERYCFCSDPCFEAFRKMYPARVHRDCYERDCAECDLCTKRYADGSEGMHMLAKDYLTIRKKAGK
jgi:hypothetical protein